MPSHSTATPAMILKNTLNSKRHRRVLLVLLILLIATFLTFTLYQPRPSWRRRSREAPYGLDHSGNPITQENHKWRGKTQAEEIEIPSATWTCTDDDLSQVEKNTKRNKRSRQCVVRNLCLDRQGTVYQVHAGMPIKCLPRV